METEPVADDGRARREAIVRKVAVLRFQAMAARGSALELNDHRNFVRSAITDCQAEIRRVEEGLRKERSYEPRLAHLRERLRLLTDVVLPELSDRLSVFEANAQSAGRAAEQMLKVAAAEVHSSGIAHVL